MSYTEMAPLDHVALLRKELELMNAAARSAKGRSQGENALIQSLPSRSRYHLLSHIDKDDDKFVDCAIFFESDQRSSACSGKRHKGRADFQCGRGWKRHILARFL